MTTESLETIEICPMTEDTVSEVHQIFTECFSGEAWSERSIREELNNPLAVTLVALWQKQVIGFINVHHIAGEGDLNDIAVTQTHRQRGIAGQLLQELFRTAKQSSISSYTLEVRRSNQAAISFYEKWGFSKVGMRKNYYTKPTEDAFLYRIEL